MNKSQEFKKNFFVFKNKLTKEELAILLSNSCMICPLKCSKKVIANKTLERCNEKIWKWFEEYPAEYND